MNNKLDDPYNKMARDEPVPIISKVAIHKKLSNKFHNEIMKLDIDAEYSDFIKFVIVNSKTNTPSEILLNKIGIKSEYSLNPNSNNQIYSNNINRNNKNNSNSKRFIAVGSPNKDVR